MHHFLKEKSSNRPIFLINPSVLISPCEAHKVEFGLQKDLSCTVVMASLGFGNLGFFAEISVSVTIETDGDRDQKPVFRKKANFGKIEKIG